MNKINWNFDMDDAPRPNHGEGVQWIIVAVSGEDKFHVTRWIATDYANADGRWMGVQMDEPLLAWAEVDHPMHEISAPVANVKITLPVAVSIPKPVMLPPGVVKPAGEIV